MRLIAERWRRWSHISGDTGEPTLIDCQLQMMDRVIACCSDLLDLSLRRITALFR